MAEMIRLDIDSDAIRYLCGKDKRLARVIEMVGPLTYTPYQDSYSFIVNQIIGQMLSNKVRDVIYGRLIDRCGGEVRMETVGRLTDEEIRSIGISGAKVRYIRRFTESMKSGEIDFAGFSQMSDEEIIKQLTKLPGIGRWTAKMYLIFSLDRPDVLPVEDVAFLQGYQWTYKIDDVSPAAVRKKCKKWSPYASIAARYMYQALDLGLTKREFHLYGGGKK